MKSILEETMKKMEEINYGFPINNKNIFSEKNEDWSEILTKQYFLQSPKELIKSKCGLCWDQVELERYYFEKEKILCESYFIVEYDGVEYPTHTFLIVVLNGKYYWFEHSWESYKGIREFETIEAALRDVKEKFKEMLWNKNISDKEIVLYQYDKPNYGISSNEFFAHCEQGRKILI